MMSSNKSVDDNLHVEGKKKKKKTCHHNLFAQFIIPSSF